MYFCNDDRSEKRKLKLCLLLPLLYGRIYVGNIKNDIGVPPGAIAVAPGKGW